MLLKSLKSNRRIHLNDLYDFLNRIKMAGNNTRILSIIDTIMKYLSRINKKMREEIDLYVKLMLKLVQKNIGNSNEKLYQGNKQN